jgi:hypothetical protein
LFQGNFDRVCRGDDREGREQQGVQHLLRDDFEWSPKARCYGRSTLALDHVQVDHHVHW